MPEIVPIAIAFVIGGLLGWLAGWLSKRNHPAQPDARLENELRQQLRQRELDLEASRAKVTETAASLAAAEANRDSAIRMLGETRATHTEDLRATKESQQKALVDLREAFKALSVDALRQTAPQFLQLANETLAKFQETAKGDLAKRQEAIATLVQPLKDQLESYQRRLQQSETSQASVLGEVKKQLEGLAQHSLALSTETFQLRKVLSSNQARGRWGEETLRRVIEAAGMSPHCDFTEQTQADDKKPDLIVRLPGNRMIIIDAKVPDLDFLHAIDSADPAARAEALTIHAAKLKETIRDLAKKDYPAQFPAALDYVVLFLPAESLFSAALEADRELILWAAQRQIMLATPASLIALLRAVSVSWQQHAQTENAREIAATAQDLYNRVAKFTEHFEKIRAGLEKATGAYNDALGSYERMVRPSGEKLAKLGGGTASKELAEIPPLELTLRLPSN
ncbi:MAG TPA: DNA recombination protein RmuC [Verrucomicrobiae bacterium]|nr:DNA recombination protein RmuC [Verrucomicrobiae bacterium]